MPTRLKEVGESLPEQGFEEGFASQESLQRLGELALIYPHQRQTFEFRKTEDEYTD